MRRLSLYVVALLAAASCSDQDFVTDVPLRVVVTSPSGGSIDAAREAAVVITFSEKLKSPLPEGAIKLETLGYPDAPAEPAAVEVAVAYTEDSVPTVTLTPAKKLPFSTVFKVSVATTVLRARDEGPLPVAVSWTFRTLNPPPLRVERVQPADASSGVARDASIRVTFSEPVDCSSLGNGNVVLTESYDPHPHTAEGGPSKIVDGTWDCPVVGPAEDATLDGTVCTADPSKCVITFVPADPAFLFRYSSLVELSLKGGLPGDNPVRSARFTPYGGQLPTSIVSQWRIVDPAALAVAASVPGAGAGQIARDSAFTLTFSEPVDCAAFTDGRVTLEETFDKHPRLGAKAGTTVAVPGAWACLTAASAEQSLETCAAKPELCQVVFTPTSGFLLEYSSDVALRIAGGPLTPDVPPAVLESMESARATTHGGQLAVSQTFAFHVVDPAVLAVAASVPGGGARQIARESTFALTFSEPVDCAAFIDGRVTLEETFDAHPRLGSKGATTVAVPGTWACSAAAPSEQNPAVCATKPELCRAVFTPAAGFLLEYSSNVTLKLAGGPLTPGAAPTALTSLESSRATTFAGQLPAALTLSFHVVDPAVLSVAATVPGAGARQIARDTSWTLTFSEPVDCAAFGDGRVTLEEKFDSHPRLGTKAGTTVAVPGSWACLAAAPADQNPAICMTKPELCRATFTASAGFLLEWSSDVLLKVAGGPLVPGAAPAGLTSLESARATTYGGQLPAALSLSFHVVDPPALALLALSPGDGASGVDRSPSISARFSEPPSCAALNDAKLVLVDQTPDAHPRITATAGALAGTWSCPTPAAANLFACAPGAGDPCVATFTPEGGALPLEWSTGVSLLFLGGPFASGASVVESTRATSFGGQLPTNVSSSWRVLDPSAQAVLSASPGDGSTGVAITPVPAIELTFARPLSCATLNDSTLTVSMLQADGSTGALAFTLACTDGATKATLTPTSAALPYSATVTATVRGGAFGQNAPAAYPEDNAEASDATTRGGQLPEDFVFTFRTQDPPPLLVESLSPSDGAEGISPTAVIAVVFSEPLDCASVSNATFQVLETFATPEDPARTAAAPAPASCTFTCPVGSDLGAASCAHAAFAASSEIQVTLLGGTGLADSIHSAVANASGGFLETPGVSFSFRALDPAPLQVISTAPNGNPGIDVSSSSDVRFTFSRALRCATALTRMTLFDQTAAKAVDGTVTCTDGTSTGPAVNGNVLIFTPSAPLTVDHTYLATALAGIAAVDATRVGPAVHGALEADASVAFRVAWENLRIVATIPKGGASMAPIGTLVGAQFNQDLNASSLVPCTPIVQTGCNVWINEGSIANKAAAIDLAFAGYDNVQFLATFDPSDPLNAPRLQPNKTYLVRVLGGASGPVGANGLSRLPTDYTWTFTTSTNSLIASVTPDIDATDVEADAPVCVEFTDNVQAASLTAGGNQISIQYKDTFGRTASLPLDGATPYIVSGTNGMTGNYVCLNLSEAPTPCFPGLRRLLYSTRYTVTVSTAVKIGAAGLTLPAPFAWSFDTRVPPVISEVRIKNAVVNEAFAANAADVPVNASFAILFDEPMNPASLVAGNLDLVALGSSVAVSVSLTLDDPAAPRSALLTVSPNLDYLNAAAGKGGYALVVRGGSGGVTTLTGNYLDNDLRYAFATSPVTTLVLGPPETKLYPNVLVPLNAVNRDLYLPSVTSQTLYATFKGTPIIGIVAEQLAQPRSVSYMANPTYQPNQSGYVFKTTDQILDFRGNPVPAITSQTYTTGNTSGSISVQPTTASQANVAPAAGTTTNGSQVFTFTQPLSNEVTNRMLGTSYYSRAPGDPAGDGTVSMEALGGAGCPAVGTRLALRVQQVIGTNTTTADTVKVEVAGPPYMRRGCQYSLKIRQYQTANLYNLAPQTTACNGGIPTDVLSSASCPTGGVSPGIIYTAESVAPTLVSVQVQDLGGAFVTVPATPPFATAVFGGTVVKATFSEPIDPATVGPTTLWLSGGVSGSYKVDGAVVTFTPSSHLSAGTAYTLSLGAVTDLAGNVYGGAASPVTAFTVESVVPTFNSVTWSATAQRDAPFGVATLTFSEPVDPAHLTVNVWDVTAKLGSVSPIAAAVPLYGCATIDPTDAKRILWRPATALTAGVAVDVRVNVAGSTAVLSDLAGTAVVATTRSFTP